MLRGSRKATREPGMTAAIAISIVVLVLALAVLAVLLVVVAGIRGDERRQGLCRAPRTRASALTRRVLGAHATPDNTLHHARADARR
jgi:hypothetical protein